MFGSVELVDYTWQTDVNLQGAKKTSLFDEVINEDIAIRHCRTLTIKLWWDNIIPLVLPVVPEAKHINAGTCLALFPRRS